NTLRMSKVVDWFFWLLCAGDSLAVRCRVRSSVGVSRLRIQKYHPVFQRLAAVAGSNRVGPIGVYVQSFYLCTTMRGRERDVWFGNVCFGGRWDGKKKKTFLFFRKTFLPLQSLREGGGKKIRYGRPLAASGYKCRSAKRRRYKFFKEMIM